MSPFRAALTTELLKSRRSRVPWGVAVGFSLAPLVGGLFMVILKDPAAARSLGLIGTKAQLTAGTADWPTFLNLIGQAMAVGGAILFAFLTAWVFGREFADRTVRGLLASATSRRTIVAAKYAVIATWSLAISAWVLALGLAIGGLIGLPGWSGDDAVRTLEGIGLGAVLTIALQAATAFFAGVGRGYLAPLGWAILTIGASQVLAVLGWGAWFPWSVPALLAGAGGSAVEPVSVGGVDPGPAGRPGRRRRDDRVVGARATRPADPAGRLPVAMAPFSPCDGVLRHRGWRPSAHGAVTARTRVTPPRPVGWARRRLGMWGSRWASIGRWQAFGQAAPPPAKAFLRPNSEPGACVIAGRHRTSSVVGRRRLPRGRCRAARASPRWPRASRPTSCPTGSSSTPPRTSRAGRAGTAGWSS